MLLRITVLQYKGAPPPTALVYMFDERGGNIGREGCNLTLPDDTRVLSRVQAQIVFADGEFSLVDQGGNPSVVNSLRVGKGLSRVLYDGDIIELCDYKLRVKAIGTSAKSGGDTTVPMRANDPMPSLDLAPPILLDPDELTGAPLDERIAAAAIDEPAEDNLEMTFDMDVDFDELDDVAEAESGVHFEDPVATVGLDIPFGHSPSSAPAHAPPDIPEILLDARELALDPHAEQAAMLSALCLGLGIRAPADTAGMLPQHMGIVMRRAMQRALSSVLAQLTPEGFEKRLADSAPLDMTQTPEHKSKLWELFAQDHARISHDAEDQFHSLFGSEFLKACEAQISRLRARN